MIEAHKKCLSSGEEAELEESSGYGPVSKDGRMGRSREVHSVGARRAI